MALERASSGQASGVDSDCASPSASSLRMGSFTRLSSFSSQPISLPALEFIDGMGVLRCGQRFFSADNVGLLGAWETRLEDMQKELMEV